MRKIKIIRTGLLVIMAIGLIVFLPVIPMTAFNLNDPVSISDARILGTITKTELEAIIHKVREKQFINAKDAFFGYSSLEIFQLGINKDGKAIVFFGEKNTKASSYIKLELNKLDGIWVIVNSRWFMS